MAVVDDVIDDVIMTWWRHDVNVTLIYYSHVVQNVAEVIVHEKLGPPCAPWCTMQVGGAQCRLMVHKVALYHWSGAQHVFHKPGQTDGTKNIMCTYANTRGKKCHHISGGVCTDPTTNWCIIKYYTERTMVTLFLSSLYLKLIHVGDFKKTEEVMSTMYQ